jgi:hypothetical protein
MYLPSLRSVSRGLKQTIKRVSSYCCYVILVKINALLAAMECSALCHVDPVS